VQTDSGIVYQFGPFEVNAASGELLKNGRRIRLQEQPYRLLVALLENAGEVISREELRSRLWPDDTFVDFDGSLRVAVRKLREALDDNADDPRYIETIPKRGYRFLVPEVRRVDAAHEAATLRDDPEPLKIVAPPLASGKRYNALLKYGITAVAVLILTAIAAFLWQRRTQAKPLTEKDVLVLADFANTTGDPVFDGTLRQGLAIQLEQSPFLKIMDDGQLQRDLRLMNLQPGARITNQIAHDVCVREGGAATIDGAIASLGKSYVITLRAITCQEGATLALEQIQAEDKEHVLRTLGSATTAMRSKLGESLNSIQKLNQPLEQATTPSLDALQNYTAGLAVMGPGQFLASVPLFERAIAIDPKFTMAYYLMGVAYEQAGDMQRSAEYAERALSMVDRVSETERTEITAYYYRATGELDKEIDAYQLAVRNNYPHRWSFHNQLSLTYIDMGQFEAGLKEGLEAARFQPNVEPPYRRELDSYICLDRLAEAHQAAAKVQALGIDGSRIHQRFLEMAYVEDDKAAIDREIRWFAGKPEEYLSFGLQAADLNVHGRRRESHQLYQRAADTALRLGLRYVADEFEEADARADALSGKCQTVGRLGRPAFALAICGEAARAKKLAAETSKALPNGTIWNAVQLPEIQAVIALIRA